MIKSISWEDVTASSLLISPEITDSEESLDVNKTTDHDCEKSEWMKFNPSEEILIKATPIRHMNTPISSPVQSHGVISFYIEYSEENMLRYFDIVLNQENDMSNIRHKLVDDVDEECKLSKSAIARKKYEIIIEKFKTKKYLSDSMNMKANRLVYKADKMHTIIDDKPKDKVEENKNIFTSEKAVDRENMSIISNSNSEININMAKDLIKSKKPLKQPIETKQSMFDTLNMVLNYDGLNSNRNPGESISDDSFSSGLSRYLMPGSPIMRNVYNKWVIYIYIYIYIYMYIYIYIYIYYIIDIC